MESLTKENFWNALYEKYPNGMKVFCDWIDEYKKKVKWDELFGEHEKRRWDGLLICQGTAPKYHDLPFAMQIGIWITFCSENGGCSWEIEDMFTYDWREDITEYIKMLELEEAAKCSDDMLMDNGTYE